MIIVSLVLSVLSLHSSASTLWWTKNFPPIHDKIESNVVRLNISMPDLNNTKVCLHDSIKIYWETERDSSTILMAVSIDDRTEIALGIPSLTAQTETITDDKGLFCDIDENHCVLETKSIKAVEIPPKLIIDFKRDTNQPFLDSTSNISNILKISPELHGESDGVWITPKQLEIHVQPEYIEKVFNEHNKGNIVTVTIINHKTISYGTNNIRPNDIGEHRIFMVDKDSGRVLSKIHVVTVERCEETSLLPSLLHKIENQKEEKKATLPFIRYKGVLAVNGKTPLRIANNVVPSMAKGDWALSLWIRCLDRPTGIFRPLFYKGDGVSTQRTPSAWFLPTTNRLAIRASTIYNPDLGADCTIELPLNEWILLSFSFENTTSTKTTKTVSGEDMLTITYGYIISIYVNGKLDIALTYTDLVLGNTGDLQMFKDPSHIGPRILVKDLILWDAPLTASEMYSLYLMGCDGADRQAVDSAVDLLVNASTFLFPTIQIKDNFISNNNMNSKTMSSDDVSIIISPSNNLKEKDLTMALIWGVASDTWGHSTETREFSKDEISDNFVQKLLSKAKAGLADCLSVETRLDLYAEASWFGSSEALYLWGMLLAFGSETADNRCGVVKSQSRSVGDWSDTAVKSHEINQALYALIRSLEQGQAAALIPISTMLLAGFGLSVILDETLEHKYMHGRYSIPLPMTLRTSRSKLLLKLKDYIISSMTSNDCNNISELQVELAVDDEMISNKRITRQSQSTSSNDDASFRIGASVLCRPQKTINRKDSSSFTDKTSQHLNDGIITSSGVIRTVRRSTSRTRSTSSSQGLDGISSLAIGLVHIAAVSDVNDAQPILTQRYHMGLGVTSDVETAAFYGSSAAAVASEHFHRVGGQPILEADRINDRTVMTVEKGNKGDEDELIQHQIVRANEGHVPSIMAMGDLYYYGARGLPRDQTLARQYFDRAAATGDANGLCGAAAMYLKGEGGDKNLTHALQLYEEAAALGSVRALNGLGYIYFYGQEGISKNETKAYLYFLAGAETETDSDALFNAGFCLQQGIGVIKDSIKAASFYLVAARKFGHFDSVYAIGAMYLRGEGLSRSAKSSLEYLIAATNIGPWSGWMRRGIDMYFSQKYRQAVLSYILAGEMGYEVGISNSAYILTKKLTTSIDSNIMFSVTYTNYLSNIFMNKTSTSSETSKSNIAIGNSIIYNRLILRQLVYAAIKGNKESIMMIGNYYLTGMKYNVLPVSCEESLWWYSKASAAGHLLSSVYLGNMYHFGICTEKNLIRAGRYYDLALSSGHFEDNSVKYLTYAMQYIWSLQDYSFLKPFVYTFESVLKWYFNL